MWSATALVTAAALVEAAWAEASSGNSTTITAANSKELQNAANNANDMFYDYVFIVSAALVIGLGTWRIILESTKYVRTLTCLNNPTQKFFARPSATFASFKNRLLYAPILGKRHNREFQLSAAINMGTLPTRFQFLFLTAYLGTQVAFCVVSIHWDQSFTTVAKELRNRSGILSVVNMVPLFIIAGRNNPLISWLNISFDTFNLIHRWLGRIVVLDACVHTGAWMASTVKSEGWNAVVEAFQKSPFIMFGLIVSADLFPK